MTASVTEISRLFHAWGNDKYSESVSQLAHAEQCAALATKAGADDDLVVAALLHDIGHLLVLDAQSGVPSLDTDDEHEATGARFIAQLLGPRVAGPIALHVPAKRYLCAVESGYFETLSPASVASLRMQGGPMSNAEATRFERLPHFTAAVNLRRWDEEAKVPDLDVASFETYVPTLERLATRTDFSVPTVAKSE